MGLLYLYLYEKLMYVCFVNAGVILQKGLVTAGGEFSGEE